MTSSPDVRLQHVRRAVVRRRTLAAQAPRQDVPAGAVVLGELLQPPRAQPVHPAVAHVRHHRARPGHQHQGQRRRPRLAQGVHLTADVGVRVLHRGRRVEGQVATVHERRRRAGDGGLNGEHRRAVDPLVAAHPVRHHAEPPGGPLAEPHRVLLVVPAALLGVPARLEGAAHRPPPFLPSMTDVVDGRLAAETDAFSASSSAMATGRACSQHAKPGAPPSCSQGRRRTRAPEGLVS